MARLPALIDLLVSFGGVERRIIDAQARALREAGLISQSKRGVGAAHLTTRDAATVLLATMATHSQTGAPELVNFYAPLKMAWWGRESERQMERRKAGDNIQFGTLYDANTLLDALQNLLEAPDGFWLPSRFGNSVYEEQDYIRDGKNVTSRRVTATLERSYHRLSIEVKDVVEWVELTGDPTMAPARKFEVKNAFRGAWGKKFVAPAGSEKAEGREELVRYSGGAIAKVKELILYKE